MPSTYTPIATTTVSGTSTTTFTFSSIASTYTDLLIVANGSMSADQYMALRFNGDTGSNYSDTYISGSGSTDTSGRTTSQTYGRFGSGTVNGLWSSIIQIQNYSNTTTNKTWLWRSNLDYVTAGASCWRSTVAINSVTLFTNSAAYFTAGTTFTLFGIKAA
jgi:hypothetical protein